MQQFRARQRDEDCTAVELQGQGKFRAEGSRQKRFIGVSLMRALTLVRRRKHEQTHIAVSKGDSCVRPRRGVGIGG